MSIAQAMRHYAETEAERHSCEVRYVAALPDNYARTRYLDGVALKRNKAAAERLRVDAWELMQNQIDSQ